MEKIDCRGLDCPGPVLKAKELIESKRPASIDVVVDNDAAVENVSRFLDFQGYQVGVESDGRISTVNGTMGPDKPVPVEEPSNAVTPAMAEQQKILIMIGSQQIGNGDATLGEKLMVNYIKTLKEMGSDLWHLIFVNHGVRFATEGSEVLESLSDIEGNGTRILVCGTCLTYLDLMDQKRIGETTNMLDIVTAMQLADKIINL
ncbi:MAG: sulfurtransferase-like selenium metabolism protein YedF [Desulfobacteraceae bacterium]|nr:MAG: sulfurtransferase-like selenium metabolism protein YedF [Desulfobacteraceae bacterium]